MAVQAPRIRVLFGVPFAVRQAGAENVLVNILRHRDTAGIDPLVLMLADGPFREEIEAMGVRTELIEPGRFREPWKLAAAILRLARLLRAERPDVVISFLARVQTVLAPAAALAGMRNRIVSWEHEVTSGGLLDRLAVALPCAWVIACSRAASDANRRLWPHRDGGHLWPGIEAPRPAGAERLAALRESLDLPEGATVLGIVGRLIEWKGQGRLVEALAQLRARGHDVVLLVVGGESHGVRAGSEAELRALADRLGVADQVRFCGHVAEPLGHVELMDILVSASDGEPFGIVLLEAMALGVPVVAVAKSGPLEILADGESGVLVPASTPGDLADGIERLLDDPGLRERIAEGGRRRYEETFTADRMARELGAMLRGLVSERRASSTKRPRDPRPAWRE